MNILWMTWKDRKNPAAGGAEVVASEIGKRLVADGHTLTFLTSGFKHKDGSAGSSDAAAEEMVDGYKVVRVGSRYSVYWHAYRYYKKHIAPLPERSRPDFIIDEINTIPFLAGFYAKEKTILMIHQLAREIWFYELFFPLSLVGYLLEPIYLWLLRKHTVITVSESSKKDIMRFGFKAEHISIITEGIKMEPLAASTSDHNEPADADKYTEPTILTVGSVRPMKRTLDVVKAFEIAKRTIPSLKLIIAGDMSSDYGTKVSAYINRSASKASITCTGKVDTETKVHIMRKSHILCVASLKEGWGLTVSEAGSQGTPAVAYDVEGVRDSINNLHTGLLSKDGDRHALAENIVALLSDAPRYDAMRRCAWMKCKDLTFERAYKDLMNIISTEN